MIKGAHTVIFSKNPEEDKIFFKEILKMPFVDTGGGWLIFKLPPSELAVHPAEKNNVHRLYLLCDNIHDFIDEMKAVNIGCSDIQEEDWGRLVTITLPGGSEIGVYQALHKRP